MDSGAIVDIRGADEGIKLKEMMDRMLLDVCTSIPAIVESFDASTMTVDVTPAIQMKKRSQGVVSWINLPKIVKVPVVVYGAGGFYHTIPITQGDDCLLVFSQRAIDNWHDQGGIQPSGNDDDSGVRHHDMTDAFAFFSPRPLTSVLSDYSTSSMELRNTDGTVKISVGESSISFTVGNTTIEITDGNISVAQADLSIDGDVSDSVSSMQDMRDIFDTHTHPYTDDGNPMVTGATSTPMSTP